MIFAVGVHEQQISKALIRRRARAYDIFTAIRHIEDDAGQQIRSKIDSFQNANFLISHPNPIMLPLIGIVSERRFQ